MKLELSIEEKESLEKQHKGERDRRVADRIKAVLLSAEGWTYPQIAQALRLRVETIQDHLDDYRKLKKLKSLNGGSQGALTAVQKAEVVRHLELQTYPSVREICAYVSETYGVRFTVSGMTQWLHRQNFSYKKPAATPAKADPEKQAEFIAFYQKLLRTVAPDEPILFGDGVHPTMATKVAYGWIRKGTRKPLFTTATRTRMNLMGSLNLETMDVTISAHETINSEAMEEHFKKLRQKHRKAPKIHLILDRGPYNISNETKASAERWGFILHHLPPYSPNLNPIERLWKVMNERTRNNRFFHTAKEFRDALFHFFETTWPAIAHSMVDRINDNFQSLKQVSSR